MRTIEFEILLSLAMGVRHGYGIIQDIESRRDDGDSIETGTLYRALQRLVDGELVSHTEPRRTDSDDERRRYYEITPAGRRAATDEARRLAALVDGARTVRLLPKGA